MKRISIVGISGSGKSTLANNLGKKLNLPVVHLDKYFWDVGWKRRYTNNEDFKAVVEGFAREDKWIIDGNHRSANLDFRLERADTIIFLDLPKWRCLWRVFYRIFNRTQPFDRPEGVKHKIDWFLVRGIIGYKKNTISDRVFKHQGKKNIFIVRNNREINNLLDTLSN